MGAVNTPAQQWCEVLTAITRLLDAAADRLDEQAATDGWMSPLQLIAGQASTLAGRASDMAAAASADAAAPPDASRSASTGSGPVRLLSDAEALTHRLPATLPGVSALVVGVADLLRDVGDLEH